MLKTTLPRRRHAMFTGAALLGACAALVGDSWGLELFWLELGRGILGRNKREGGSVERCGLMHGDFAHGFPPSVIEHRPQR